MARKSSEDLLHLKARFDAHMRRHAGVKRSDVLSRLEAHPKKIESLREMERSGGEPDVVGRDAKTGELRFVDCSEESPEGRQSLCYDRRLWIPERSTSPWAAPSSWRRPGVSSS